MPIVALLEADVSPQEHMFMFRIGQPPLVHRRVKVFWLAMKNPVHTIQLQSVVLNFLGGIKESAAMQLEDVIRKPFELGINVPNLV